MIGLESPSSASGSLMFIRKAADVQQLYAELRSLAGPTRAVIDALVAAWYLEFRVRTSRAYAQWIDPALHEIAAALVFGVDARPGCARLGTRRALAGFSEAEVRDDLASLAQVVATDPTLEPPPSDELLAAALAGWHSASGPQRQVAAAAEDLPGTVHLRRLLGHLVAEDSEPAPIVVVVDVGVSARQHAPLDVAAALDRVEAAGPGPVGVGWFELAAGSRYAAVTRRTRGTAHVVAVLRGVLRVAPEFSDHPVHVWIETVPRAPAALPAFVRGLTGRAEAQTHLRPAPARAHPRHSGPKRARGHARTRHPKPIARPERWLASAAALLLVVLAVGTFGVESPPDGRRGTATADPPSAVPRSPAPGDHVLVAPPVGGVTGTPIDDGDTPAAAPGDTPQAPAPVVIEPTPVAHVEPVQPVPGDPPSSEPTAPAPTPTPPPPAPNPAPAPGPPATDAPEAAPVSSSGFGPPLHALSNMPDHAAPKAVGHPPERARIARR